MTTTQYAKGDAVWVYVQNREHPARVVTVIGESVVVCSEDAYALDSLAGKPLAGKAYGRGLVRERDDGSRTMPL